MSNSHLVSEGKTPRPVWVGIMLAALLILAAGWYYAQYTQAVNSAPTLVPVSQAERDANRAKASASPQNK